MSQCPKCQTELADDFGLVTCPGCQASLFIDFDGEVQSQEDSALAQDHGIDSEANEVEPSAPSKESQAEDEMAFDEAPTASERDPEEFKSEGESFHDLLSDELGAGEEEISEEVGAPEGKVESPGEPEAPFGDDLFADQEEEEAEDANEIENDSGESLDWMEEEEDSEEPLVDERSNDENNDSLEANESFEEEGGESFEDIAAYGNSEESLGKEGTYRITVILEDIDTSDLRDEIRDSLEDEKFMWDLDQIMSALDGGRLVISDISPVKASLFVNRIKHLPISICWEQHAIY